MAIVGSPHPAGTPRATISTTPPTESLASRAASIVCAIRAAAAASGQRTGLRSVSSQSRASARTSPTWTVPPDDAHADRGQRRLGERAGGDAADRLAARRAPAAAVVAHAVLLRVDVVGVAGSEHVLERGVVARARVSAAHDHRDRRAERHALEHAAHELDPVGLLALRRQRALAGPPAIEIALHVGDVDADPRRHAVDDDADRRPV